MHCWHQRFGTRPLMVTDWMRWWLAQTLRRWLRFTSVPGMISSHPSTQHFTSCRGDKLFPEALARGELVAPAFEVRTCLLLPVASTPFVVVFAPPPI